MVRVEPKDSPLNDLIGKVIIKYLNEIAAHLSKAFTLEGYLDAATISGTRTLHRDFFNLCTLSSELKIAFENKAGQLMDDVQDLEALLDAMGEANLRKLELMEQLAVAMRPGHAWRKELDAAGLGQNADRWLSCWDENITEIQALKKNSTAKTGEMGIMGNRPTSSPSLRSSKFPRFPHSFSLS